MASAHRHHSTYKVTTNRTGAIFGWNRYRITVLPADDCIVPIYLRLMQTYNLLPNDALILASAKIHPIPMVTSYDPDFKSACAGEGL